MERIESVVIGAGVIGLAVARALALSGREVIVLEREGAIGTGISSRNSEVIHAGMYYPSGSLKARLCVAGNRMLREYAESHNVAFNMVGKLIVATDAEEEKVLDTILGRARANGVTGLAADIRRRRQGDGTRAQRRFGAVLAGHGHYRYPRLYAGTAGRC